LFCSLMEVHLVAGKKDEQLHFLQSRLLDAVGQSVIATDLQGNIIYWNSASEEIYGWSKEEVMGRPIVEVTPAEEMLKHAEEIMSELRAGRSWSGEFVVQRRDGSTFPAMVTDTPVHDEQANLVGIIGVSADISERKALEAELERRAAHDLLTDLPNRHAFVERLGHALQRTGRKDERAGVGVLFMDLDGFKTVNDSLGHEAGDRLLVAVAGRIQNLLRYEDTLARFGGDEFAVLLERVEDPSEAIRVARRIVEGLREPFSVADYRVSVNTSIGIALGGADTADPEGMLREADTAMYRAKEQAPGRYEVFDPAMHARAQERLELEAELGRAVEQGEFVLHYQPIVSLRDGGMVGFEALLRWQHPEKGLQLPDAFLPLAEETDQIVPIDEWVLGEVCRQAKRWEGDHPSASFVRMNVNLSPRQLKFGGLARTIEKTLTRVAPEVHTLALDITEGFLLRTSGDEARTLDDLKKLGIRLELDDFGTGYSSLSYLKDFPVDSVKLDKTFVEGLGGNATGTALVRKIIEMCHTLGLEVLAEGIETPEQAALLKEMGCDLGQGYYFGRPLPSEEFAELLPNTSLT
jgi:diguanylate cyclase (GGDEF)-like protein/PAS domain S-box-containing protein